MQPPSRGDVGGVHGGRAHRGARGAQHRATGGVVRGRLGSPAKIVIDWEFHGDLGNDEIAKLASTNSNMFWVYGGCIE